MTEGESGTAARGVCVHVMLRVSLPCYYQQRVTNAEEAFFDLNVGVEE